jgi:hypothetical protein
MRLLRPAHDEGVVLREGEGLSGMGAVRNFKRDMPGAVRGHRLRSSGLMHDGISLPMPGRSIAPPNLTRQWRMPVFFVRRSLSASFFVTLPPVVTSYS